MPDEPTHPAILASEGNSPPPKERGIGSDSVKPAKPAKATAAKKPAKATAAKKPAKARKAKK